MKRLELLGLENIGEVKAGDSLAELIVAACSVQGIELADNDVLVVAQKIVSKAEGRTIKLKSVQPSERAQQLAAPTRQGTGAGRGDSRREPQRHSQRPAGP